MSTSASSPRRLIAFGLGLVAALSLAGAPASAARGHFSGLVEIRGDRGLYLECSGSGSPTVVLESGFGNAADVWSGTFLAVASDGAFDRRQAVLPAVSRFTRVCAYDRPGTGRLDGRTGEFEPSRSDPVAMPRTALDIARDLRALFRRAPRAAGLRGRVALAGHSAGGLAQRLFASLHPSGVAGLVLVDATPDRYGALLAKLAADGLLTPEQYAAVADPPPPPGLENYPEFERLDLDASGAQVRQAQADTPLRRMPFEFLSLPRVELPADWGSEAVDAVERMYRTTQAELAALVPGARHVVATASGHYIQLDEPDLVVGAIRRVVRRSRAR